MKSIALLWKIGGSCIAMAFVLFSSCSDDAYDLKNPVDKTVEIGGDSLYFPLGTTQMFTLDKLLGEGVFEGVLQLNEDSCYVLRPKPEETSLALSALDSKLLQFEAVEAEQNLGLAFGSGTVAMLDVPVELELVLPDVPSAVRSLQSVRFQDAAMELSLEFPSLPAGMELSLLHPALQLHFPESLVFAEDAGLSSGNTLSIQAFNTTSGFSLQLPLESLETSDFPVRDGRLSIPLTLRLGGSISVLEGTVVSEMVEAVFHCRLHRLEPESAEGVFSPDLPVWNTDLDMGVIPDALQNPGANLDFERPYILVSLDCNADIPMNADLEFVPWSEDADWSSSRQQARIHLPAISERVDGPLDFYLCNNPDLVPEGGIFVETDVPELFRHMPDLVLVNVRMESDTTRLHTYSFVDEYHADVAVHIDIPVVFGQELFLPFGDTLMNNIPESLSVYMEEDALVIYGEAINTYPMDMAISLMLLDADHRVLPLETGEPQILDASTDGKPVRVPVEYRIVDSRGILAAYPMKYLYVSCEALSNEGAVGLPVRHSSFFQAFLKLKKTGGIAFDLDEIGAE